jgi:hypothetical protein
LGEESEGGLKKVEVGLSGET